MSKNEKVSRTKGRQKPKKKALIISGGGSRGAFAVGAIKALRDRQMLDFDLVAGSSTGALIVPLVVTREIDTLIQIYSNTTTDQVVRKRFLPWALLFGDSLFDTAPLAGLIQSFLPDSKAHSVLNSETKIFLATTELQSGKVMYFSNGESPHPDVDSSFMKMTSPHMLRKVMLASSNQPIFMPPISINGRQFMDGGLRDISPVKVALLSGIPEITIIDMIPEANEADNSQFTRIPAIVGRGLEIMSKEIVDGDIFRAQKNGIKLTIIRPPKGLNKNPLEFDPIEMKKMIGLGYETANEILG